MRLYTHKDTLNERATGPEDYTYTIELALDRVWVKMDAYFLVKEVVNMGYPICQQRSQP